MPKVKKAGKISLPSGWERKLMKRPKKRKALTEEQKAFIIKHRDEYLLKDIADVCGCTYNQVRHLFNEKGIK